MRYDAIIFDLDGTAVENAGHVPTPAMRSAIQTYQNDLLLCAATGRSWVEAEAVVRALGLVHPMITSGGSMIIDPVQETVVWQEVMSESTGRAALEIAQRFPYEMILTQGLTTTDYLSPGQVKIAGDSNIMYILDVPLTSSDFTALTTALRAVPNIVVSMPLAWRVEDAVDLHITSSQATKEHAVIELCDMLHLDRARVAGVGDGQNDTHLFNAVGYKVAMGNAVPELKEAADMVIGDVADDGLAQFISEVAKES